jgi:hypothetical protein
MAKLRKVGVLFFAKLFAIVGMSALFAATGFIAGAIGAPIYNWTARRFGGLELDIEQ